MNFPSLLIFPISVLLSASVLAAEPLKFSSGEQQVQLLELYTSQGCSSCPPADRWINRFTTDNQLWKQLVPLAFHVDYWDYLGWRDIYASNQYTDRQRRHRNQGNVGSVYTPGFVHNGKEWKGWFSRDPLPVKPAKKNVLSAQLQQNQLTVNYPRISGDLVLNVAVLGFDIKSPIRAGENAGKELPHEFVVMAHDQHVSSSGQWQVDLPSIKQGAVKRFGLALWVSPVNVQRPLQATGGWLPVENLQKL